MGEVAGAPPALVPAAWSYLDRHRVGHLAMVDVAGRPLVVPLCYATDGETIYSALDDKPKRVRPAALARVRAIRAHPAVTLVVDDYSEDWTQLAYLLVRGQAAFLDPGSAEHAQAVALLRVKYAQYRAMAIEAQAVLRLRPQRSTFWTAHPASLPVPAYSEHQRR